MVSFVRDPSFSAPQIDLSDLKFRQFEQLVKTGKIILIFDAFDEMADRVNWDITIGNFRELTRCADLQGKVIITCRTHYFKDRKEQIAVIGALRASEIETALYQALGQRDDADVVYLQEYWEAGCHDNRELLKRLRTHGYPGSLRPIVQWTMLRRPLLPDYRPRAGRRPSAALGQRHRALTTGCTVTEGENGMVTSEEEIARRLQERDSERSARRAQAAVLP